MVGKSSLLMPSLTQLPTGELRFRMMRTAPVGFILVIMPFNLAPEGTCANGTGPLANFFVVQSATASVTCSANSYALGELVEKEGSLEEPLQPRLRAADHCGLYRARLSRRILFLGLIFSIDMGLPSILRVALSLLGNCPRIRMELVSYSF